MGQPGPSPLDDPGPLVDLAVRYQTARWVEDRRAAAHTVALMSAVADPTLRAMLAPLVRHPLTATERQWAADVVAADRCYWYRAVADWLDDGASATRLSAVWHAATRRTAPVLVGAADPPARWTAPTPWAAAAHQRPDTTRLPAGLPAVALPAAPPPERAESDAHAPSRRVLRRSADWYHHQLVRSPAAEEARRYLIDRGITPDDWRKWNLGWAPAKWRGLCAAIRDDEAAVEAGVANTSKGRVYDVLRGRLVFPIRDLAGDVIGFAGRKLPGDDPKKPKYLNTRTTPLYRKTDTLYGIAEAAEGIRSSGSAGVVEGYTDAIAAHKAGLTNVVATGGTAFTDSHLTRILAAGAHHLVAAFDGDQAGHDAQRRVVDQAHRTGVPTTAVSFPAGEDPASLDTDALVEHWWAGLPQPWTHINQHLSGDDIHSRIRGHRALAATYADGDPILAAVASHQALVHTLGATPQTIAAWRRSTTPAQSREQADTSRAGLSL